MIDNTLTPMSVYVIYAKGSEIGSKVYNDIYNLVCKDETLPVTDAIGIQVFLEEIDESSNYSNISLQNNKRSVIFFVIDELVCEYHLSIVNYWLDLYHKSKEYSANLCPIFCKSKYTSYCNHLTGISQGETLTDSSHICNEDRINLLQLIARELYGIECSEKLQLFISHAKKDAEEYAISLKSYIDNHTKLQSFFDRTDIQSGHKFEGQLTNNLNRSFLVVLKSNAYSEREWCMKETLLGKEKQLPIVCVSLINGIVKRTFPYFGNVPLIRFNDNNWDEVIIALLQRGIYMKYQQELLTLYAEKSDNISVISYPPELLDIQTTQDKTFFLYPEPPLGLEELSFLKKKSPSLEMLTLGQYFEETSSIPGQRKVAISVSESEDSKLFGVSPRLLKDFTMELFKHLLVLNLDIVYGGDLRKEGYTTYFKDLMEKYNSTHNSTERFHNFFAWPIYMQLETDDKIQFQYAGVNVIEASNPNQQVKYCEPDTNPNKRLWANSLSVMRNEMTNFTDARILIGGKVSCFKGRYAGILEEFLYSLDKSLPIYLIGGFGGASRLIVDIITGNNVDHLEDKLTTEDKEFVQYYNSVETNAANTIDYSTVEKCLTSLDYTSLNNGLSENENKILFYSKDIIEVISIINKGLTTKFK